MRISTYGTGHSLQYFEGKGLNGGAFAVLFNPEGRAIFCFEPELALKEYWPRVQATLNACVFIDATTEKGELE